MNANDEEEKPLDPAVDRVRRKMVRLLAISIGIMMVGLMAVLASIVYKITSKPDEPAVATWQGNAGLPTAVLERRISLPEGARIVSTDLDGGNVLVHLQLAEGGEQLLVYSLGEDRIVAKVAID